MTTNSQNPARGRKFEYLVGLYLKQHPIEKELEVHPQFEVNVGISTRRMKKHPFDWGNDALLVECKAYSWTNSGKNANAKFATANEAILYFSAVPSRQYRKMLFMPKTARIGIQTPESLVEHYVRRFGHLISADVEVFELDARTSEYDLNGLLIEDEGVLRNLNVGDFEFTIKQIF